MKTSLKVLTLNSWFLKLNYLSLAKKIRDRLKFYPSIISQSQPDVILFQEIWGKKERDFLISEFSKTGFPFYSWSDKASHYGEKTLGGYIPNLLGNGLLILSKYPLEESGNVLRFSRYTSFQEVLADKGALHVILKHPSGMDIDLYNTHLGAMYLNPSKRRLGVLQRKIIEHQIGEFITFVKKTRDHSGCIIGGDFNLHEDDWLRNKANKNRIQKELRLEDTYRFHNPCSETFPGITFCHNNPYTLGMKEMGSRRLDYIFSSRGENSFEVGDSRVLLLKCPEPTYFLSDHYGVLSTLLLQK